MTVIHDGKSDLQWELEQLAKKEEAEYMRGLEGESDARRKSWSAWTKAVVRTGLNPAGSAERGAYGLDYWLRSADETSAGEWATEIGMFVIMSYGISKSTRAGQKAGKAYRPQKNYVNSKGKAFNKSERASIDNFNRLLNKLTPSAQRELNIRATSLNHTRLLAGWEKMKKLYGVSSEQAERAKDLSDEAWMQHSKARAEQADAQYAANRANRAPASGSVAERIEAQRKQRLEDARIREKQFVEDGGKLPTIEEMIAERKQLLKDTPLKKYKRPTPEEFDVWKRGKIMQKVEQARQAARAEASRQRAREKQAREAEASRLAEAQAKAEAEAKARAEEEADTVDVDLWTPSKYDEMLSSTDESMTPQMRADFVKQFELFRMKKNPKEIEIKPEAIEQATDPSAFADADFIRAWYTRDATARARMRRDYSGLRKMGIPHERVMLLLGAMAAIAGVVAGATAAAGTETGTEDDRGLDGLTDSDDEDDDMDLGEDVAGLVSVSKEQLHHALTECDRAYYPETIPEELRARYITIDNQGSKAVVYQHTQVEKGAPIDGINDFTYEVSFRGTSVETLGTIGQNAISDLNSHLVSLDIGFVPQQMYKGKRIELEEKGVVTVGFAKHLDLIYNDILASIPNIENADIVVNGHSLGAVCAQLFALRLFLTLGKRVSRVYSFGSPRGFDTFTSYVAENLEVIQVLDERDPVTYMYPVFYEGHAGYKIVQTEHGGVIASGTEGYEAPAVRGAVQMAPGEIITYGADELIPWHARNLEDSRRQYQQEQNNPRNEYFSNNWEEDVGILNSAMKRTTTGFREFVTQFKDKLLRDGAARFLECISQYGFTYHYQPNYYDMIQKMPDTPYTFEPSVSGIKRIESLATFVFAEPPEGAPELHFTDYWQWTQPQPASRPASRPIPIYKQPSMNLADYVTPEMLANGFVVYDEKDAKNLENNFIQW